MLAYEAEDFANEGAQKRRLHRRGPGLCCRDAAALRTLASQLIADANAVALLGSAQGDKVTVIFARGEQALARRQPAARLAATFRRRRRGRPDFAQGGGIAPDRLADLITYAAEQAAAELASKEAS